MKQQQGGVIILEQKLSGRCLCGNVQFAANGEPISTVNCHCDDCRQTTGAVFGTVLYFQRGDIEIHGVLNAHTHKSERGTEVQKRFCGNCGSTLFTYPAAWPDLIGIRAGCITQPAKITPKKNVFMSSRLDSTSVDPNLQQFPAMP